MISSNDLRINNLVLYRGEVSVVKGVLKTSVDLLVDPCVRFTKMALLENIEPIPLTEEWLVKMGIDNDSFSNFSKKLDIQSNEHSMSLGIYFSDYKCEIFDSYSIGDYDFYTYKHMAVHQLQNLYYALTGQELTIKL